MGQRLNIEIARKGDPKPFINCYFHWAAYTIPAADKALWFMREFKRIMLSAPRPGVKPAALAAAILAWDGSGILEEVPGDFGGWKRVEGAELDYVLDNLGFGGVEELLDAEVPLGEDRNSGLICITGKGMAGNDECSDFTVRIDVSDEGDAIVTRFDPLDSETISTYEEDFGEKPEYLEVPEGVERFYLGDMSEEDLKEMLRLFDKAPGFSIGCKAEDRMLVEVC